jgi:hypothetical protein
MGWHSDAKKNLKKMDYRLCKFWCPNEDLPSNTETARGIELIRQLVSDEDETQTHWQHSTPPTRITILGKSYFPNN